MKIFLGSDHRGYYLKERIAKWLFEWQYDFFDVGAQSLDLSDDYTKYASEVASLVANEKSGKGIVLCGSGVGVDVVVNKFDGIRASVGISKEQVKAGRNGDDMNILVIAADYTDEYEAKDMVQAFLETKFGGKERYKRRLKEIEKIEANN
ncbi:ribose-5-phosphate isomerase [Candidatus Shapirobacteria bacterium CG03_land_8_20_14_0_80_39_12]|uniref:Ribose-5-phosphate isomerase n=2 Tax=Candidatus Shapironibacteriota TaxID=1752721 RepID=A0A2M7BBH1_9BACT|nr:MAG: ribose-5-phosphate isomerase [Candidatus Shapirobacteria bacterium CG03_land_8_20_14_0_80_39_12]PJC28081.1 MAG: ribose-5-phosphate isomerase [Candidatus Shapirobacteria bacterium CG_4_9_14_0_2_um_filter_39_11]